MSNTREICLPDGRELSIEYSVTHWGCPSNGWDEPGEAAEIEVSAAIDENGDDIWLDLEDEVREMIESDIVADVERDGPSDDYHDEY